MASIAFKNVDGSTLSRVTILKDGRALEVNPSTKKTWPSMAAWVQEMPKQWPRVEAWASTAALAASKASATGPTLHVQPQLAYFLRLPEGVTTSTRATIRDALASYMDYYKWGSVSYWKKCDVKPANPLYYLDDFLVTLTGLDPRGEYTARQILNAVLARQTRAVAPAVAAAPAVAPVAAAPVVAAPEGDDDDELLPAFGAAPGGDEEKPLEENPEIVKLTALNAELGWNYVRLRGENKRLKAEIEALQARLCTIRAAACI